MHFEDITSQVREAVSKSGITEGIACIFSMHTTSCIRINENEERLLYDFKSFLERLAPASARYLHDDIEKRDCPKDEPLNGHSHLKSLLLGASETVPVVNGEMLLGKWQSIFHVDLDGVNRQRKVMVKVMGD